MKKLLKLSGKLLGAQLTASVVFFLALYFTANSYNSAILDIGIGCALTFAYELLMYSAVVHHGEAAASAGTFRQADILAASGLCCLPGIIILVLNLLTGKPELLLNFWYSPYYNIIYAIKEELLFDNAHYFVYIVGIVVYLLVNLLAWNKGRRRHEHVEQIIANVEEERARKSKSTYESPSAKRRR